MNTFFKTFFLCLVVAFGFLAYKVICVDSYSPDLNVSKNNPVFGVHKEIERPPVANVEMPSVSKPVEQVQVQKPVMKKNKHKCYFYSNSGKLLLVERELEASATLENALSVLLKGPLIPESKKGIYSEIPANVDVISVERINNKVIINLSKNFGKGGGSKSVENRVKQLSKTAKLYEPNKLIYLYIDGKEVEYLGGDGVYIKQPLD